MNGTCDRCGEPVLETNAFCTKCGAKRNMVSASSAPGRLCTKCGSTLAANSKFCNKCGHKNAAAETNPGAISEVSTPSTIPIHAGTTTSTSAVK